MVTLAAWRLLTALLAASRTGNYPVVGCPLHRSMKLHSPTEAQHRLLSALLERAGMASVAWLQSVQVCDMDDGGMGSFELVHPDCERGPSTKVVILAEVQFTDLDQVEVIASLYGGTDRRPFEVDVWKTDFSPVLAVPLTFRPVEQ